MVRELLNVTPEFKLQIKNWHPVFWNCHGWFYASHVNKIYDIWFANKKFNFNHKISDKLKSANFQKCFSFFVNISEFKNLNSNLKNLQNRQQKWFYRLEYINIRLADDNKQKNKVIIFVSSSQCIMPSRR